MFFPKIANGTGKLQENKVKDKVKGKPLTFQSFSRIGVRIVAFAEIYTCKKIILTGTEKSGPNSDLKSQIY